jgi:tetratricopeptide (TPR) repeat protein
MKSGSFGRGIAISAIALAALAAPARSVLGQSAPFHMTPVRNGITRQQLEEWVALTQAHQPGVADRAAERAAGFTPWALGGIVFAVQSGDLAVASIDVPGALARGAVLHTDIANAEMRGAQTADRANSGGLSYLHFGLAAELVGALNSRAPGHPLVRAWCVAVASVLTSQLEVAITPPFIDSALQMFPGDPQLRLLAGAARELRASARVQDATDLDRATRPALGSAAQNLSRAEEAYRRVLGVEPGQVEARIRLGRILGLTGRHTEALAELGAASRDVTARRASGAEVERPVLYFLALFLGEENEATDNLDAARRSYARALDLYPGARSAWLDLSRLEWRNGARAAAAAAIARMADAAPGHEPDDPWKDYFCAGPARHVDETLQALAAASGSRQ